MKKTQIQNIARRYTAAWCSQDARRVASFYAANGSLAVNGASPAIGREAIAASAQSFMSSFPDLRVVMDDLVFLGDPNCALYYWTLTGTNRTGDRVKFSGFDSWTLDEDGLIAESQGHCNADESWREIAAP